eukprot:TRINITY_DN3084_c0_g1_i1.p1 TRINITY_DN3084_c0_g1~~TRINITY_DN3084_c0_g1_i1.p1  ORF type:complete len:610 (+),score=161.65 TRINITY_DN3084_c0_g1_i1:88-1917(+)
MSFAAAQGISPPRRGHEQGHVRHEQGHVRHEQGHVRQGHAPTHWRGSVPAHEYPPRRAAPAVNQPRTASPVPPRSPGGQQPEAAVAACAATRAREESVREIGLVLAELRKVKTELVVDTAVQQGQLPPQSPPTNHFTMNPSTPPPAQFSMNPAVSPAPPPAKLSPASPRGAYPDARVQDEIEARNAECAGLRQLLADERRGTSQLYRQGIEAENRAREAQAQAQADISALQAHVQELQKRIDAATDAETVISALRLRLKDLQGDLHRKDSELRARDSTIDELRSRALRAKDEHSEMQPRLVYLQAQRDEACEQSRRLEGEVASLKDQLAVSIRKPPPLSHASSEVVECRKRIQFLEAEVSGVKAANRELSAALAAQPSARAEDPQSLSGRLHSAEEPSAIQHEMEELQRKVTELELTQIEVANQRDDALVETIGLRSQLLDADDELRTLRDGELEAAKCAAKRSRISAAQAGALADDAREALGDVKAHNSALQAELALIRRDPSAADALRATGSLPPQLTEHRARILIDSWQREARRLRRRVEASDVLLRRAERAAMACHDVRPPAPEGWSVRAFVSAVVVLLFLLSVPLFVYTALWRAAARDTASWPL